MFTMKTIAAASLLGLETMANQGFQTSKFTTMFLIELHRTPFLHTYIHETQIRYASLLFVYEMK